MATPTTAALKAILDAGTYPSGTLATDLIYDYPKPASRKRYPSLEIELDKPQGFNETKEGTRFSHRFKITYFHRVLGTGTDDIVKTRAVEDQITTLLSAATLGDHKIINEVFDWNRTPQDPQHPHLMMSVLTVFISESKATTAIPDGVLVFDLSGSTVNSPPGADYTYTNIYDVEISEGYASHEEMVSSNPKGPNIPVHFSGKFRGRFLGKIHAKNLDLGVTGDKLNQMFKLGTATNINGEKQEIDFIYTNKTADDTPSSIQEVVHLEIDDIQRAYSPTNQVEYRIIGTLIAPSTITVS
jgi:hypothetical protein